MDECTSAGYPGVRGRSVMVENLSADAGIAFSLQGMQEAM